MDTYSEIERLELPKDQVLNWRVALSKIRDRSIRHSDDETRGEVSRMLLEIENVIESGASLRDLNLPSYMTEGYSKKMQGAANEAIRANHAKMRAWISKYCPFFFPMCEYFRRPILISATIGMVYLLSIFAPDSFYRALAALGCAPTSVIPGLP